MAWNLMVELRKELVESQKIRCQMIQIKIAFVSAGIGLIFANFSTVPNQLLVIPAFAAIFFDFLINSYSFSIKRIGHYCRKHIEPLLRAYSKWPQNSPLWEEYMCQKGVRQNLALIGNMGITSLTVILAIFVLVYPFNPFPSIPGLIVLLLFACYDAVIFRRANQRFQSM